MFLSQTALLATCSAGGTGLSTFTMTNSSSATTSAYIKVQYKITDNDGNDGGWVDYDSDSNGAQDEITVGVNSSGTATINVPVGSKITWRYETSQLKVVDKLDHIQRIQLVYLQRFLVQFLQQSHKL